MSHTTRPPFNPELAIILGQLPPAPQVLDSSSYLPAREADKRDCDPTITITDSRITHEEKTILTATGVVAVSIIQAKESVGVSRPGIYWIHGGGMISGNKLTLISLNFPWVLELDVVLVSVEYRLAPENTYPAQLDDCYTGLQWMSENAPKLGINPEKIMIAGGSAGAGLAAGVALLARDRHGPSLFAQLLIYPMLDDRCCSDSIKQFMTDGTWTGRTNIFGWDCLLPGTRASENVSIYAAPARATDLTGLPQTYIEVGNAEPFRDENVAYASLLWTCGVDTELHVWPGAWHGYDVLAPNVQLSKDAVATRMCWLKRIFASPAAHSVII
ncbi:hypothetical protein DL98DRAFT_74685 [Cadophora sp. DSE1049]|nr:hypothetical protein DL98DRAFT_74685 [Cadophora sp. DSE1049]